MSRRTYLAAARQDVFVVKSHRRDATRVAAQRGDAAARLVSPQAHCTAVARHDLWKRGSRNKNQKAVKHRRSVCETQACLPTHVRADTTARSRQPANRTHPLLTFDSSSWQHQVPANPTVRASTSASNHLHGVRCEKSVAAAVTTQTHGSCETPGSTPTTCSGRSTALQHQYHGANRIQDTVSANSTVHPPINA